MHCISSPVLASSVALLQAAAHSHCSDLHSWLASGGALHCDDMTWCEVCWELQVFVLAMAVWTRLIGSIMLCCLCLSACGVSATTTQRPRLCCTMPRADRLVSLRPYKRWERESACLCALLAPACATNWWQLICCSLVY